jgi:uncharacterized protein YndB with AHSA1/START domain
MKNEKITVNALVHAPTQKVWQYYTQPEHITKWNFADPSWHCPSATNDMRVGGSYVARMEAKDGSFGFDFDAIYTHIDEGKSFTYEFGGRESKVDFEEQENGTQVWVAFDPENENELELQRAGWQAILNNFKSYTENN